MVPARRIIIVRSIQCHIEVVRGHSVLSGERLIKHPEKPMVFGESVPDLLVGDNNRPSKLLHEIRVIFNL